MISEKEYELFKKWQREQGQSELARAFNELEDLITNPDGKAYNSTMPVRAFRIMAQCILLLKKELLDSKTTGNE